MSPVRYELGVYIPEDDIPHSHRRENLKSYHKIGFMRLPSVMRHPVKYASCKEHHTGSVGEGSLLHNSANSCDNMTCILVVGGRQLV
jgi:hypothetical protein